MISPWKLVEYNVLARLPNGKVATIEGNMFDVSEIIDHPGHGRAPNLDHSKITFVKGVSHKLHLSSYLSSDLN